MWFPESTAWNLHNFIEVQSLLPSASGLQIWKTTNQFEPNQVRSNQSLVFEERVKSEYSRKNPKTRGKTSRSMESTRESNLGHKNQGTLLLPMEQNECPISSAFVLYWRSRCDVAHQMKGKSPLWYKWRERTNIWFCLILYLSRFQNGVFEVTYLSTWNC